jgi:5,5'-dehydrodivanillate O-demethylase
MLAREENELLSRVGPGTPAGELLRRYWYPVAFAQELSEEKPTHLVRLLGEDLVLFRDRSGNVGLLADHCAHRGASLLYGRVEERGLACAYHGWLYDTAGSCLETPAEPAGSMFHLTVKQRAYPVRRVAGLYWAYLGPLPAPALPPFDLLVRRDGRHTVQLRGQLDCNYLQPMENAVDPAHVGVLHRTSAGKYTGNGARPARGYADGVLRNDFRVFDYGIMKQRFYEDGSFEEHPLIFPNILRQGNGMEIRVPKDDTHTWVYEVRFIPLPPGELMPDDEEPEIVDQQPHKDPLGVPYPNAVYRMNAVDAEDYMVWETQGAIPDRSVERLATSDHGVVLFRDLLRENIEKVQRGEDPLGVIRDPNPPMIDTNLTATLVFEGKLPADALNR